MPTDRSEKRIYELQSLSGALKADSYFAVSQDNLTRKVTLSQLRLSFSESGDYYTAAQIDALIQQIYDRINDFNQDIINLTRQIEALGDRIEEVRNELLEQIQDIQDILANLYRYGTEAPERLEEGQFYFQYFEESIALPILDFYSSRTSCIFEDESETLSPPGYYDYTLRLEQSASGSSVYNYNISSKYSDGGTDFTIEETNNLAYLTLYSDDTYSEESVLVEETEITMEDDDLEEGKQTATGTIAIQNIPDVVYAKISKKENGSWSIFPDETFTAICQYGFVIRIN